VIVNCANRAKDVAWFAAHRRGQVTIDDISTGRSILAIQGPKAAPLLDAVFEMRVSGLGRFDMVPLRGLGPRAWIARTGYTGSDGFEVFLPDAQAVRLWQRVREEGGSFGVRPIGLGARDTLRLEAGLRLYGADLDETTSPFEADLGWTVAMNKPAFIGREALLKQKGHGVSRRLVGFELAQGPVPRHGCALLAGGRQAGTVTSGTFSLLLNKPIGMGYVEADLAKPGTELLVSVRAKQYPATVVKLPFWRGLERRPPPPLSSEHLGGSRGGQAVPAA